MSKKKFNKKIKKFYILLLRSQFTCNRPANATIVINFDGLWPIVINPDEFWQFLTNSDISCHYGLTFCDILWRWMGSDPWFLSHFVTIYHTLSRFDTRYQTLSQVITSRQNSLTFHQFKHFLFKKLKRCIRPHLNLIKCEAILTTFRKFT